MSYYDIKPSHNVNDGGIRFSNQNNEYMYPKEIPGGFRTRGVDSEETVAHQLTGLLDDNSSYITQARQQAAQQANSRGLMNSSLAAGAGQAAAIQAGLPIAQQDASTYARTHADNMGAENAYLLSRMQEMAASRRAGMSVSASIQNAKLQAELQREKMAANESRWQSEFDRNENRYNTDWERQQLLTQQQNKHGRENFLFTNLFSSVMNNPQMWSDPQAAMGFVNYYARNFDTMYNDIFGGGAA